MTTLSFETLVEEIARLKAQLAAALARASEERSRRQQAEHLAYSQQFLLEEASIVPPCPCGGLTQIIECACCHRRFVNGGWE